MDEAEQRDVITLLSRPESYGAPGEVVEVVRTHASIVFLCRETALKLKRAVRYSYLDYSTPALREAACREELTINQRIAPVLYLAVHPITRETDGHLALDGSGEPVDWVVAMRRFPDDALFDRMAVRGALTPALVLRLADAVLRFHGRATPSTRYGGTSAVAALIDSNALNLARGGFDRDRIAALSASHRTILQRVGGLLDWRRANAFVRQCHGDLHLGNICLYGGEPTPFDAIEFDQGLATIDVLYDLAFLLMDLLHRDRADFASLVFNRYLDAAPQDGGLAALPLFLSIRAAIRAHVNAAAGKPDAGSYFDLANRLIEPVPARLIAIGGLSGVGKSTLAAALASELGLSPGARVLRSDIVRKRLFNVAPTDRLPEHAYSDATTRRVLAALQEESRQTLAAGYAVILDSVAAHQDQRHAFAALARNAGVPFTGLWLEAPRDTMERRIAARRDDVSDATVEVLRRQLDYDLGPIDWIRVDAENDPAATLAVARTLLKS
jgi:uncharacterized protein